MAMIIINVCIAAFLVWVALYKRDNATILALCVCSLLVIQGWLSLHYAAAYREVPQPSDSDLAVEPLRIWLRGTGAMNYYTLTTYVPTFGVFAIALAILALAPSRTTDRNGSPNQRPEVIRPKTGEKPQP